MWEDTPFCSGVFSHRVVCVLEHENVRQPYCIAWDGYIAGCFGGHMCGINDGKFGIPAAVDEVEEWLACGIIGSGRAHL